MTSMRRAMKRTGGRKLNAATRAVQKAMAGFMLTSATSLFLDPLTGAKPKPAKTRRSPSRKPKAVTADPVKERPARNLGAVLKELRAARPAALPGTGYPSLPGGRYPAPAFPQGARYLARSHSGASGARDYKLYLPASQQSRPKGLIVMLHGCKQTPDDFALGTEMNAHAERHGLAVAYPAQTGSHNAASCWNWFRPGDQKRGGGEPAILAGLAAELTKEFGLGRETVFVAGLSAGGAMASILADVYPEIFAAAGVHSGLARGAARDVMSALSAMRSGGDPARSGTAQARTVRRIVFHGDADSTVHPSNASMIVRSALNGTAKPARVSHHTARGRGYARSDYAAPDGTVLLQLWMIEGAGHAWSGGNPQGSYADASGPDASAEMVRFFLAAQARREGA